MARCPRPKKKSSCPKKKRLPSINPFFHFLKCVWKKFRGCRRSAVLKYAVQKWRKMSRSEKQPFIDAACRAQYLHRVEKYGTKRCPKKPKKKPRGSKTKGHCPEKSSRRHKDKEDTPEKPEKTAEGPSKEKPEQEPEKHMPDCPKKHKPECPSKKKQPESTKKHKGECPNKKKPECPNKKQKPMSP